MTETSSPYFGGTPCRSRHDFVRRGSTADSYVGIVCAGATGGRSQDRSRHDS